MTIYDVNARWTRVRTKLRARAARHTPRLVTNYPFEVFATLVGLIIGLPLLVGLAAPTSLVVLLPTVAYWIYAAALVLGSATVAIGLKMPHPLVIASGIQLLGGSYAVYGLAVVALAGWAIAWSSFACFIVLGVVCTMRASHFRRLVDIQEGARRLSKGRT